MLNRQAVFDQMSQGTWDLIIIGGGATGLGTALDAISRGYRTLLLEQSDFAKATSSRSTKLIHGGVRYLKQGNVSLVRESLHERGLLLRNAPELVRPLEFIIPAHSWWEKVYYAAGLKAYDLLAGRLGMAGSQMLSRNEVSRRLPKIRHEHLNGGISYFDAQFDDARLAVSLARTFTEQGGVALNYARVRSLMKEHGRITGAEVEDGETGETRSVNAKVIVNATGIFSDEIRRMDEATAKSTLSLSQGAHLVVDQSFLPGGTAIIVPETDDGRVVFLIPWHGALLIGTTDIPIENAELEPRPLDEEVDFLIDHANRYLSEPIQHSDIRSCFAGLRPLVRHDEEMKTSKISRDHVVRIAESGLISITGGKWTTFRKMGEDAVDAAVRVGKLPERVSKTESIPLRPTEHEGPFQLNTLPTVSENFIRQAVRQSMARTVEDVLARRSRMLFVNAAEALQHAPTVARVMAEELQYDEHWMASQLAEFQQVAEGYQLA